MATRVLIIEDEFPIALDLQHRLEKMGYIVIGIAGKYKDALTMLAEKNYDIVLLDINLEEKKSGIDLGTLINQNFHTPTIFITAYSDNKTFSDAAKANPMGYITKPFSNNDLERSIVLAMNNFKRIIPEKYQKNNIELSSKTVFIKDKGVIRQISIEEILWLDAMDNYTIINTLKERIVVNSFLKVVLDKLGDNFARIHRSYAVAINKIKFVEDNTLFIGDRHLSISRTYKSELIEKISVL